MRRLSMMATLVALIGMCFMAHADLGVEHTRLVQRDGSPVSMRIWNDGPRDSLVQAWIDVGEASERPEQLRVPYVIAPPMFKLSPGRHRDIVIRPISGQVLPSDRESVFWLNILDIPSRVQSDEASKIEYAVSWRIKLFHRPLGLKGSSQSAAAALEWGVEKQGGADRLIARNGSAFHVSLTELSVDGRRVELQPSDALIAPFSTSTFSLSEGDAGVRIRFRWVDDKGKSQPGEALASSGGQHYSH